MPNYIYTVHMCWLNIYNMFFHTHVLKVLKCMLKTDDN